MNPLQTVNPPQLKFKQGKGEFGNFAQNLGCFLVINSVIKAKVLRNVTKVQKAAGVMWCKCGYHLTLHVLASKWLLGESWHADCDSATLHNFNFYFLNYNYQKKMNTQETTFKSTFPFCLLSFLPSLVSNTVCNQSVLFDFVPLKKKRINCT